MVELLVLGVVGCSVFVDTSELDAERPDPEQACSPDEKACRGRCVSRNDPAFGCGAGCEPCQAHTRNAIFECVEGRCEVVACLDGYGCPDCSVNVLIDSDNCGACGNVCHNAPCSAGVCNVSACVDGYADCENGPKDGCETNLAESDEHCGACDSPCPSGSGCVAGKCEQKM